MELIKWFFDFLLMLYDFVTLALLVNRGKSTKRRGGSPFSFELQPLPCLGKGQGDRSYLSDKRIYFTEIAWGDFN
ncbi:MAG: hypothetical protein Q8O16_00735, partial [Dehalococcoidia bacterium]|nr:hypothetical protein [Dehalococcoidia bacterium]